MAGPFTRADFVKLVPEDKRPTVRSTATIKTSDLSNSYANEQKWCFSSIIKQARKTLKHLTDEEFEVLLLNATGESGSLHKAGIMFGKSNKKAKKQVAANIDWSKIPEELKQKLNICQDPAKST